MSNNREMFPLLLKNPELAYFDNAATTLKPQAVIDAVVDYYENLSANVGRGDHHLANLTTQRYQAVREKLATFLNVSQDTVVFTSGASHSLNLIAQSWGSVFLEKGDVVLLNEAEHASNVLPWFELAHAQGIVVEFIPLDLEGKMNLETLKASLHEKVKLVSIAHASNVLGFVNDIGAISDIVHEHGALLCVDGAQAVGHMAVDLSDLDVDFYSFSAHKMLGPTGVGVMYGKAEHLEAMQVFYAGGGSNVRFNSCGDIVYKKAPAKFEVGTPNIEGVLGFGAALDVLNEVGMDTIHSLVEPLRKRCAEALGAMDHVEVFNQNADLGIVSFGVKGIFAQDVAAYLSSQNIAVRAGEHCAKLLTGVLHNEKSVRVSLYFYNTMAEVDRFIDVIREITLEKCIDTYLL